MTTSSNFIVSTTFPSLSPVGLSLSYGVYTFFALPSIGFVREMKGCGLEERAAR